MRKKQLYKTIGKNHNQYFVCIGTMGIVVSPIRHGGEVNATREVGKIH